MEEPSGIEKDQVQDHLQNMKVHKCRETEEMHSQILRKLADESYLRSCGRSVKLSMNGKGETKFPLLKKKKRKTQGTQASQSCL